VRVRANDLIRRRRRGIVRSPALRRPAFIWLKDISIGFQGNISGDSEASHLALRWPADTGDLVRRKIVEHHDVVALEGRGETALDVGQESMPAFVAMSFRRRAISLASRGDGFATPFLRMARNTGPAAIPAECSQARKAAVVLGDSQRLRPWPSWGRGCCCISWACANARTNWCASWCSPIRHRSCRW
jgi:hypothetical protein